MSNTSVFSFITTIFPYFTIIFICSVFIFKLCFANVTVFFSLNSLPVSVIIFSFSKLIVFIVCCYAIFSTVYIILIFYAIRCPYSRFLISARNMIFTCFCCRWSFRIIFAPIYFLNWRFKIHNNNRWYLIRFLVLTKL